MNESVDLPNISGYVSVKEAAKMLGLADKTVYQYVVEGRIPAVRAADVILISLEEVQKFKPNISGRPRKSVPIWRTSPEENQLLSTLIVVQTQAGKKDMLIQKLEEIRLGRLHLFPGTIARYIIESNTLPGKIQILLIWRSSVMPDKAEREKALEMFRQVFADVLDWNTVEYEDGTVLMHT
jgi:excisionase family DNA binding protein